jgi:hypothetical protein
VLWLRTTADVAQLLHSDIWAVGLDPSACIRQVGVIIAPGTPHPAEDDPDEEYQTQLPKNFKMLAGLQASATVTLMLGCNVWVFESVTFAGTKRYISSVAECVFPTLEELLSSGVTVAVSLN